MVSTKHVIQFGFLVIGVSLLLNFVWIYPSVPTIVRQHRANKTKTYIILDYTRYTKNELKDFYMDNCLVTTNPKRINDSHAVVIANRLLLSKAKLPKVRHAWQRWVWLLDENPYHALSGQSFKLNEFNHFYNWTMTYRSDSDVYAPHGWTVRRSTPSDTLPSNIGNQTQLIVAVMSNCGTSVHNHRMEYMRELNRTAKVNLFGGCGKPCRGYVRGAIEWICPEIKKHLFYLAFENSNCKEYIEKLFGNAFSTGAVPVVMGPSKADYQKLSPPNSFIHTRDFDSPAELGVYLKYLSKNKAEYMKFHDWRKNYDIDYRLQFIHKSVWTPLCKKLNVDDGKPKTIPSLDQFWNIKSDCNEDKYW